MNFSEQFLLETKSILEFIKTELIEQMVDILVKTKKDNGRLFIIGSGGGAGHASHAVCDFRKLCGIESYAPYDNISELTARVNDEGWDTSISKWLAVSNLRKEDCILVLSVGGGSIERLISMNLVNAIKSAKNIGTKVIGIVGKDGGYTKKEGDSVFVIPTINKEHVTPHTEGFQAIIWHLLVSHPKLQINKTTW